VQIPKFRKATVSFVMLVLSPACSLVRMKQLGSQWTNFCEAWYLSKR